MQQGRKILALALRAMTMRLLFGHWYGLEHLVAPVVDDSSCSQIRASLHTSSWTL